MVDGRHLDPRWVWRVEHVGFEFYSMILAVETYFSFSLVPQYLRVVGLLH